MFCHYASTADHWLRIDLLQPYYITKVKVKFFGEGGNGSSVAIGGMPLNYGTDNYRCGDTVTYSTNSKGYYHYSFVCGTPQLGQYINIRRFGVGPASVRCPRFLQLFRYLSCWKNFCSATDSKMGQLESCRWTCCYLPGGELPRTLEGGQAHTGDGMSVYVGNKTSGLGRDNELCATYTSGDSNPIGLNCTSSMHDNWDLRVRCLFRRFN
eukprot:m.255675 g.255675  ORF g.255675 m.255675 type:complete len:210 (+) comp40400_c1_seq6:3985-4614(+)